MSTKEKEPDRENPAREDDDTPGARDEPQNDVSKGDTETKARRSAPKKRAPKNDGPPDLDDLWRDFSGKLNDLFNGGGTNNNRNRQESRTGWGENTNTPRQENSEGRSGGNGGNGIFRIPEGNSPRLTASSFLFFVIFILLIWASSGFYTVDESQRGIVLLFGKYKETTEPGLRWRLPYPFQSHEIVNLTGVRTIEVGYRGSERDKVLKEALMLTDDENIVNIQFAVQYILKDPVEYLFKNRETDQAVIGAAESALREIVGKSKMNYVLYEGREQIATQAAKLMQDILDRYESGVLISKVTMQNAQPPEQVQAAFDDAVKAGQDRERQKNEGQAYANDVIPKAQGTAARLLAEAEGYKQRVISVSEGDASRFNQLKTEYTKAPEVTRQRLYLETMEHIFSSTRKVFLDTKGQGNLLYLPLDKLMQAAGVVAADQGNAPGSAAIANRSTPAISNAVPPQLESAPAVGGDRFSGVNRNVLSRERGER